MKLLIQLAILSIVVALLSAASTFGIGRWKQLGVSKVALLILGPIIDALIGYFLLDWLSVSGLTLWAGAFAFGMTSHVLMQPLLVPQRLVVWRLAKQNILRRKRQAALLMVGLIIASAIITSSMVVGDSLDATVRYEVEGAWGETDITISGFDLSVGQRVTLSESLANEMWDEIQDNSALRDVIEGQQQGLVASASVASADASLTGVTWMAMNSTIDGELIWPEIGSKAQGIRYANLYEANIFSSQKYIVVNEVLAEELDISVDDELEVGWYVTEERKRIRVESSLKILDIVSNEGQGASAGTQAPALFTDLATAQSLQRLNGSINSLYYAVDDAYDDAEHIEPIVEDVEQLLDRLIRVTDVGLKVALDENTNSLTLTSSQGLGRLSGELVRGLRGNLSQISPGSSMMEVLQVPMIELVENNQQILTLADSDISQLQAGENGLWHFSPSGAGFQIEGAGDAWVWRVDEGGIAHDFTLDASGEYGLIATDTGLIVGYEGDVEEEEWASFDSEGEILSVTADANRWWALEQTSSSFKLHSFSLDLEQHIVTNLSLDIPSTVLSSQLHFDEYLYLEIESLLSSTRYQSTVSDISFSVLENSSQWPSPQDFSANISLHSSCDGRASVTLPQSGHHWCTVANGLIRWDSETGPIESLRIPIVSTAGGLGVLPQLFLAFGGEQSPIVVDQGDVLFSQRLNELNLSEQESEVWVKGLIPYAFGDNTAYRLNFSGTYADLEGMESLSELDAVILGLVSLTDGELLASAGEDERSMVVLSVPGQWNDTVSTSLTSWLDNQSNTSDANLNIRAVKVEAAAIAEESSGILAAMFLVFGTFTIAAGILLVLTIVMMLAEARRSELGTMRALGVTQSDVRALAILEGIILSALASILGAIVGLILAWFISIGFDNMFSSVGSNQFAFAWEWTSLFSGAVWGFLLAVLTLWGSAFWTSKLNIISALRGGRIARSEGIPWFLLLLQILALGGGSLALLILLVLGFDSSVAYFLWMVSGVCAIIAIVPFFTWELPIFLRTKNDFWQRLWRNASRNTLAMIGFMLLIWTIGLSSLDPVRKGMEPDELSFIVLGLVEVFAGVLLLTSAAPLVVKRLGKSKILTRRWGPVLPVSLAYPLATPVRTAVVMGMFSITVFSVIVLGGYAEQFDNYTSSFVEDAEGDYELLLTGSRSSPIELSENISEWNLSSNLESQIDSVARIHRGEVFLEDSDGERMPYVVRGFDDAFAQHGGLPLHVWDSSLGDDEFEVWNIISSRDDLVLLDASFGLESITDGSGISTLSFSIGDSISLIDISNPGNTRSVRVAGFLEQSSYLFSAGVWMNDEPVIEQFDGRLTRMYVSVSDDAQPSASYQDDTVSDFSPTGKSKDVRMATAELELELSPLLNTKGVQVSIISDEVMLLQSLVLALLGIFEGYLALGLIVGIAGIGVVTVRSVSERTKSIGILRALGYRKNMVLLSFFIEVSWVSVLGMLNGILVAVGFHRALYMTFWKDQGASFSLPMESILLVFFGGWILVLLATFVPIHKAAKIPASAALRES